MKRLLPFLFLTLSIPSVLSAQTSAPEIEERKGVMVEPPPPQTPGTLGDEMIMLGDTRVPAAIAQKLNPDQITQILKGQASAPPTTAQAIFNEEVLVPGIVFGSLTIVSFLILYFSFRKRREMLDTVRVAIQSGQTLPASFLEALEAKPKPTPDSDLRKAIPLIALGLSGMGVLAALAEEEAGGAWSIGLVPTLLGIGYLFLWLQSQKRRKAGSNDDHR